MAPSRSNINREATIASIEKAFLEDFRTKGIEGISVTSLCKKSEVSRSTFYLYFDDKYSVLQEVEDRLLKEFWEINKDLPDITDEDRPNYHTQQVIDYILANKDWYMALLGPYGDGLFVSRWRSIIKKSLRQKIEGRNRTEEDVEIQTNVFASGLIGIFTYVLFENQNMDQEVLGQYMTRLLGFSLRL